MTDLVGTFTQTVIGTTTQVTFQVAMVSTGMTVNVVEGGGSSTAEFVKTVASTFWFVTHNRGYRPIVQVLNEAGEEVFCDVLHISVNAFSVSFNVAMKGSALYT